MVQQYDREIVKQHDETIVHCIESNATEKKSRAYNVHSSREV